MGRLSALKLHLEASTTLADSLTNSPQTWMEPIKPPSGSIDFLVAMALGTPQG